MYFCMSIHFKTSVNRTAILIQKRFWKNIFKVITTVPKFALLKFFVKPGVEQPAFEQRAALSEW